VRVPNPSGCEGFVGFRMQQRLRRRYGLGQLHFITCSCYHRKPSLRSEHSRHLFLKMLGETRDRYDFALLGYVVMPEHVHLLIGEPNLGSPSTVMQVLKQRVSRAMHQVNRASSGRERLLGEVSNRKREPFWQRRFYDFNVWSVKKKNEKMNYMHFNPVKRGLVEHPKEWVWSSYGFYSREGTSLCAPNPQWKPKT
jgi:putative transposase